MFAGRPGEAPKAWNPINPFRSRNADLSNLEGDKPQQMAMMIRDSVLEAAISFTLSPHCKAKCR